MREVSRQSIRLNLTRMLTNGKNRSFYMANFHNRPIVSIDGYDETVHRRPFRLSLDRQIVMDDHDLIHR